MSISFSLLACFHFAKLSRTSFAIWSLDNGKQNVAGYVFTSFLVNINLELLLLYPLNIVCSTQTPWTKRIIHAPPWLLWNLGNSFRKSLILIPILFFLDFHVVSTAVGKFSVYGWRVYLLVWMEGCLSESGPKCLSSRNGSVYTEFLVGIFRCYFLLRHVVDVPFFLFG